MPKIDHASALVSHGSSYPKPFDEPCLGRSNLRLSKAAGLTQFGVNLTTLEPGAWSSQRHWHSTEDEFVYVLEGEVVLVEDDGETVLRAGDCAAWKAGIENAHHLINRSSGVAKLLTVGARDQQDHCEYPDVDLRSKPGRYGRGGVAGFTHKDGTPY